MHFYPRQGLVQTERIGRELIGALADFGQQAGRLFVGEVFDFGEQSGQMFVVGLRCRRGRGCCRSGRLSVGGGRLQRLLGQVAGQRDRRRVVPGDDGWERHFEFVFQFLAEFHGRQRIDAEFGERPVARDVGRVEAESGHEPFQEPDFDAFGSAVDAS